MMSRARTLRRSAPSASTISWFRAAIAILVFFYAFGAAATAHADSTDPQPGERIDSLCHPWSTMPCLVRVAASLRSATSGGPLSGKRLRFVAGNTVLCSSTTDVSGWASCLGVAPSGQSLAETGYRAIFDGDDHYWAESAAVKAAVRHTSFSE